MSSYTVRHVVNVDRPELRDDSFAPRAPGAMAQRVETSSRKLADALVREILAGEYDFAAEFVSSVEVYQTLRTGKTRQILPVIRRERAADGTIVVVSWGVQ